MTNRESAQTRWRAVNAPHLVALVRAGARFEAGKLVERPDEDAPPSAAEIEALKKGEPYGPSLVDRSRAGSKQHLIKYREGGEWW